MLSKILALAVLVASTQALSIRITPKAAVEIKECLAGTADWFEAYRLDVTPMPIEVAAGKDVTLDGEITLKQMVEVGATLALKLTGEVPVIGKIPIPCLEVISKFYKSFHNFTFSFLKINFNFRSTLTCILDPVLMTLEVISFQFWRVLVNVATSCQKVKLVHFH